jgi:Fe-S-cluster containining protein
MLADRLLGDRLSALCTSCGLCCDGTLFTQVPLTADEAGLLRARGLTLRALDDRPPALPQRCAALDGRCCTIYAERPAGCRRYRCMLHAALAGDELELHEARALVDETHALIAALGRALPAGPGAPVQRARAGCCGGDADVGGRAALGDVARQLGRHFEREAGRG